MYVLMYVEITDMSPTTIIMCIDLIQIPQCLYYFRVKSFFYCLKDFKSIISLQTVLLIGGV